MRRGFTLIELLVATGVFMFGFTAAFAMFLAGTRARAQADGLLRLSLATSSLVEEFRLEAGRESGTRSKRAPSGRDTAPYAPMDYVGDGFAAVDSASEPPAGTAPATPPAAPSTLPAVPLPTLADELYRYPLQPGIWYRVLSCVDEKGDATDHLATALQFDLLVVWNPSPDPTLPFSELVRRHGMDRTKSPIADWSTLPDEQAKISAFADYLVSRGLAVRERAVVIRRASWER